MRCSYSTLVKAKRAGRATSVRATPTGTAVTEYQVSLGNRHSLKEAGVIGLPSWSEKTTQTETWVKVSRLSATCPRRVVVFDGGKGSIDRTMEFGDDFDGAAVDTAKWTVTGTPSVSGGIVTLPNGAMIWSKYLIGPETVLRGRINLPFPTTIGKYAVFGYNSPITYAATENGPDVAGINTGSGYNDSVTHGTRYIQTRSGGTWGTVFYVTTSFSGFAALEIARTGTTTIFRANSEVLQTRTAVVPTATMRVQIGEASAPGYTQYADWVTVRKYTANEPLAGTAQPSATNRALSRPMRKADLIRACCT